MMYKREKQVRKFFKNDDFKQMEYLLNVNDELYKRAKAEVEDCNKSGLKPPWQLVNFIEKHEELMSRFKLEKAYRDFLESDKELRDYLKPFGVTPEQVDKMSDEEKDAMFKMGPEKYKELKHKRCKLK